MARTLAGGLQLLVDHLLQLDDAHRVDQLRRRCRARARQSCARRSTAAPPPCPSSRAPARQVWRAGSKTLTAAQRGNPAHTTLRSRSPTSPIVTRTCARFGAPASKPDRCPAKPRTTLHSRSSTLPIVTRTCARFGAPAQNLTAAQRIRAHDAPQPLAHLAHRHAHLRLF